MTLHHGSVFSSLFVLLSACSAGGDESGGSEASGPGPLSFASESGAPTSSAGEGDGTGETGATGDTSATGVVTTGETGTVSTSGSEGGDSTTGEVLSEDEVLMRAAIAGEEDAGAALRTIAERGGLPVITSTGSFLFGCLCGPGTWNLSGMHNGWVDDPMGVTGPLAWAEAEIDAPAGSLYKFHDSDQDQWIADPLGRRYGFDDNGRYTLVRAEAAHLERWFAVEGEGLGPRDLQVWVPDGGQFTHALYVHDGQNLFDPGAFFGGWRLQESVPPGVLLVGIDNTGARLDEYTHVPDVSSIRTRSGAWRTRTRSSSSTRSGRAWRRRTGRPRWSGRWGRRSAGCRLRDRRPLPGHATRWRSACRGRWAGGRSGCTTRP
jgi:hypothetical protein